jgi:hypothetical protein
LNQKEGTRPHLVKASPSGLAGHNLCELKKPLPEYQKKYKTTKLNPAHCDAQHTIKVLMIRLQKAKELYSAS